jgi:hypothetical protein
MIVPVYLLVRDIADTNGAGFVGYDLVLFVGAIGAGYAARQFTDATWTDLAKCFLTAGLIGILSAIDVYSNTTTAHPFGSPFDAPRDAGLLRLARDLPRGRVRRGRGVVPRRARFARAPSG